MTQASGPVSGVQVGIVVTADGMEHHGEYCWDHEMERVWDPPTSLYWHTHTHHTHTQTRTRRSQAHSLRL